MQILKSALVFSFQSNRNPWENAKFTDQQHTQKTHRGMKLERGGGDK